MPRQRSNLVSRPILIAIGLAVALATNGAWAGKKQITLEGFEPDLLADTVQLVDQRPEEEKKGSMGSLVVTSCNYAVRRLADDISSPDRMTLLRSDLAAMLGGAVAGKQVVVKHYGVYVNDGPRLRGNTYGRHSGILPEILKNNALNCPPEKMNGGWYDFNEHTTEWSPVIAEITVQVDGRTYVARGLISPEKLARHAKDPYYGELVFQAMRKATRDLVTKMQPQSGSSARN